VTIKEAPICSKRDYPKFSVEYERGRQHATSHTARFPCDSVAFFILGHRRTVNSTKALAVLQAL